MPYGFRLQKNAAHGQRILNKWDQISGEQRMLNAKLTPLRKKLLWFNKVNTDLTKMQRIYCKMV